MKKPGSSGLTADRLGDAEDYRNDSSLNDECTTTTEAPGTKNKDLGADSMEG